ncbi:type II toxin-antitoxin system ParD family antitoxin [bacterium]|nr:MAG: type II toxin-antitoxin system ParD family antitoxin [bacterium]
MEIQQIELTVQQANFIRSSVDAGRFADASEAVRAGLKLLERQERIDELKLEHMRRLVQEGIDDIEQGRYETITADTIDDFMESVRAESRRDGAK